MIFSSPYGRVPSPSDKTIWDYFESAGNEIPNAPLYVDGLTDRTITYGQALEDAKAMVAGFLADGIRKGDVVILHSFNIIEYPIIYLALSRMGAICSPSSPMFSDEELAVQIEIAKASAVITHHKLSKAAVGAAKMTNVHASRIYTVGQSDEGVRGLASIEEVISRKLPYPNLPAIDPNSIAILPFSSGTSGRPKGVALAGRALLSVSISMLNLSANNDTAVAVLPFFHIFAIMMFHSAILERVKSVVIPGFDPEGLLALIQKYRPREMALVPPVIAFLAKDPRVDKYDLSSVKYLISGAAPLGKELDNMVSKRLNVTVRQGYGMTEFCAAVTLSPTKNPKPGASGVLFPNAELKIKDLDTDEDLGVNKSGELLFRSPQAMNRYVGDEEANKRVFAEDGFIRTGDIGYIDEDGFIFVVDRLKEMIKYKAHQIAPAEIEDVLGAHPKVADSCCVRGVDADGEEIPKAFVVLKPGESATPEEIIKFVAGKVAGFKKVREVEFIDVIPKSASGKILRRQLQQLQDSKTKNTRFNSKL